MYKIKEYHDTSIERNASMQGEPLEHKIVRVVTNKEPIKDGAPIIFSERKDGVISAYNIRTDRFEVACEAMDIVTRTEIGRRMERIKEKEVIKLHPDGEAKTIQGTDGNQ